MVLPMYRSKSSEWAWASAVPPFIDTVSFLQSLVRILKIGVNCVTPLLTRIHAVRATFDGDGTLISMHMRPSSSETHASRTGPLWDFPGILFKNLDPSTDLNLVNSLQGGKTQFPLVLHSGLVLTQYGGVSFVMVFKTTVPERGLHEPTSGPT